MVADGGPAARVAAGVLTEGAVAAVEAWGAGTAEAPGGVLACRPVLRDWWGLGEPMSCLHKYTLQEMRQHEALQ